MLTKERGKTMGIFCMYLPHVAVNDLLCEMPLFLRSSDFTINANENHNIDSIMLLMHMYH